jgi:hypothetical protein
MWPTKNKERRDMQRFRFFGGIALCIFGIAYSIVAWSTAETKSMADMRSSDAKNHPKPVLASDLCNGDYQIIGLLGKPYGEVSKIRAVWEKEKVRSKPTNDAILRITHIDGKRLEQNRQIVVYEPYINHIKKPEDKPSLDNHVYEGRVFESGGYPKNETSDDVEKILHLNTVQKIYGFAFHTYIYLID